MDRSSGADEPSIAISEGGPWGGDGGDPAGGDGLGPRNPWSQPPRKRPDPRGGAGPSAIDGLVRKARERFGGGMPQAPAGKPIWIWGAVALLILWLLVTAVHRIEPGERGVVTRFGKYVGMLQPGMGYTLPAPIDRVTLVAVENIRATQIGSTAPDAQNLMLTNDKNVIDLAYSVRWNVRDPELYLFELANPDGTVRQVAESAMRAEISRVSMNDAIGSQRNQIETLVSERMQQILDGYHSGITIQGVAINQADPPAQVMEAFKQVSAAQQEAQNYRNSALGYAQQLREKAFGEAAAFDKVYGQYKLAPEVTRRRMYYETMERVLAKTDKTIVAAPGVTSYLPLTQLPKAPAK